jgi:hypothetical protein
VYHNEQTSKQRIPAQDEIKLEQSNEALSQFPHSKRGHISKKEFELEPRRKTKFPRNCFQWYRLFSFGVY